MSRRFATAVLLASLTAIAAVGTAVASSAYRAKTYRAHLTAVAPAAGTAGVAHVAGRAQLVDGKRRNKVSLHLHGLAPKTTYLWHVHVGTCAATGAPVAGWTYRTHDASGNGTLTSNKSGNASTGGRSTTFNADPTKSYSVNVHVATPTAGLPAGTIIACGDLKRSRHAKAPKS